MVLSIVIILFFMLTLFLSFLKHNLSCIFSNGKDGLLNIYLNPVKTQIKIKKIMSKLNVGIFEIYR